jgi:hypothetical protein
MHDPVVAHESQRSEHLGRKSTNEGSSKANKAISLNQLVQVDTKQLHSNTQMVSEVEMLSHLDDMMFFIRVLSESE